MYVAWQLRIRKPVGCTMYMQATKDSGNGKREFNPSKWLSEDGKECASIRGEEGFFAFGKGLRKCPGQSLATIELVTFLAVLAREAKSIEMLREECERDFVGVHPTGIRLTLTPRSP